MRLLAIAADQLVRILRVIGGVCLAGMMFLTCLDVMLRYFGRPIFGAVDIVQFLAVLVLGCAMPYTHQQRGHASVNLIAQKLSSRSQSILDAITSAASLLLFAIVTWQMWLYARELAAKGEVSMTAQIPTYPFVYAVSVCFGILCLTILCDAILALREAVDG